MESLSGIPADKAFLFQGVYQSSCVEISSNGKGAYARDKMRFTGLTDHGDYGGVTMHGVNDVTTLYADSNCNTVAAVSNVDGTYAFTENNKVLTLTATTATMTPKTQSLADELNTENFCGSKTWANNVAFDLMNSSCKEQSQKATYFVSSTGANVDSMILYQCADDTFTNCSSVTYTRQ